MLIRIGVIIVAWLAILSGAIGAFVGGFAALAGALLDTQAPTNQLSMQGISGMALVVIGLTFMIAGVAQIIFGVGLWQLRGWAWTLGVVIQSLTLLGALGGLFTGAFTVQSAISIVISGAILFYLLSPRVRKLFGQRRSETQIA
jgi:uncharacterized membrane protein (DUF2068 family)